jgi:uncharacterized protein (TIGR02453 family)
MSRFDGWPPAATEWFTGLEVDNSRAYWTANREVYEAAVRSPMEALLAEVADEFGSGKVFRPYRDVRFSVDKSPYKTHTAAVIERSPAGVYYVEVSADGLLAGAGYHAMARDQLERFRGAVDEPRAGARLEAIWSALAGAGFGFHGEVLKTAPRGFSRDHPRIELLRRKDAVVVADLPTGPALRRRIALDHVTTTWRAAADLLAWLDRHVGGTQV